MFQSATRRPPFIFMIYSPYFNPEREDDEKPKVNSVAWLVLLGDALHNFVDGMSIGAGFTENVYTGISVSLAVLCEELPHELGDHNSLLTFSLFVNNFSYYT